MHAWGGEGEGRKGLGKGLRKVCVWGTDPWGDRLVKLDCLVKLDP